MSCTPPFVAHVSFGYFKYIRPDCPSCQNELPTAASTILIFQKGSKVPLLFPNRLIRVVAGLDSEIDARALHEDCRHSSSLKLLKRVDKTRVDSAQRANCRPETRENSTASFTESLSIRVEDPSAFQSRQLVKGRTVPAFVTRKSILLNTKGEFNHRIMVVSVREKNLDSSMRMSKYFLHNCALGDGFGSFKSLVTRNEK
ncbi:hypothetical protein CEXT_664951 [Caerostris extrusa]|uniref:Uncharacterized protein n=1 Tax=Caerostris extrusa TaxID=172846 RepID=A0AAV4RJ65_CAEEX|nr:hypothetical protein CEXT_664951 [Caerostris extrusa]